MVAELKGLVLAGGHSTRFGSDKAAVVVNERPQLQYLAELLSSVISDVRVSVRPEQSSETLRALYPQVADIDPGLGPTGGLLAAHEAEPAAAWLVVACDMPCLNQPELQRLIAARSPQRGATAYVGADGLPEPLCAIYEPATLAALRAAVLAGGVVPGPRSVLVNTDTALLAAKAGKIESFNTQDELASLSDKPGAGKV